MPGFKDTVFSVLHLKAQLLNDGEGIVYFPKLH